MVNPPSIPSLSSSPARELVDRRSTSCSSAAASGWLTRIEPCRKQWHALEPADGTERIEAIEQTIEQQVRTIAQAQAAGHVDATFAPGELLAMIFTLTRTWVAATPEFRLPPAQEKRRRARRRRAVVEATRRLVTPAQ